MWGGLGFGSFRPMDASPGALLRPTVVSPDGRFVRRALHHMVASHDVRFARWSFRPTVSSYDGRFDRLSLCMLDEEVAHALGKRWCMLWGRFGARVHD